MLAWQPEPTSQLVFWLVWWPDQRRGPTARRTRVQSRPASRLPSPPDLQQTFFRPTSCRPPAQTLRYAASPCRPPSRPNPDSRYPPNGLAGSNRLYVLAQTTPARNRCAIHKIRLPFSVQTPAESPYGVLFAFVTASWGVRKVSTESTGPKISSRAIRCDWLTPVKTVGANQYPRPGSSQGGDQRCAPSASPASDSSRILSSC